MANSKLQTIGAALAGAAIATALLTWRRRRTVAQLMVTYDQVGGFAGQWASPGLGVDDSDEAVSGISKAELPLS